MRALLRAACILLCLPAAAPAAPMPQVAVGPEDYPVGLVPGKEERVTAAFTSGPDGRTQSCRIAQRSHVPALDAATCSILVARARFAPAGEQRIQFIWTGARSKEAPESRVAIRSKP